MMKLGDKELKQKEFYRAKKNPITIFEVNRNKSYFRNIYSRINENCHIDSWKEFGLDSKLFRFT